MPYWGVAFRFRGTEGVGLKPSRLSQPKSLNRLWVDLRVCVFARVCACVCSGFRQEGCVFFVDDLDCREE